MSIVAEKMKKILQTLGMQATNMATELGITKGAMSDITTGRVKNFSGSIIELLRLKYNVNPIWLQSGEGEMFLQQGKMAGNQPGAHADQSVIRIPILGSIAAGHGIESWTDPGEYLTFPSGLFKPDGPLVAVEVTGSEMEPRILQGDIAIIRQVEDGLLRNTDVVAARIDNVVVLAKFSPRGDQVELIPEDGRYPIWKISGGNGDEILGRVVAIFRSYEGVRFGEK